MAFGKQLATLGTCCVFRSPPQAVMMLWVWAWGQDLGGMGEADQLLLGKMTGTLCLLV